MAKKSRSAEARVQQQKQARQRQYLLIGGGLLVALLLIGGGALAFSQPRTPTSVGSAPCGNVQLMADEGRGHLSPGDPTPVYKSVPPTSGTHSQESLPAGIYDNNVDVTKLLHSLEHGYVVIYYNGISDSEKQQLETIRRSDPFKVSVAPYPNMPYKVALTAWTHRQTCDGVNENAIRSFINQFRGQGPEPLGAMN